ncbi:MAG: 2-C-methyl-D-erythritol 4-phosphate cytidylyltransferase [Muribaculaceae bacterium]|nr:2-C-methyl-D-erythritol 4-phosphate cytidylyltransferase [Muribaculaceae bacterium]
MGGGIPKQFRNLCRRPVLWWSMKAFHDEDPETQLILVLPEEFIGQWKDFFSSLPATERFEHCTVAGGKTRGESVKKGLEMVNDPDSLVAVHDGARPLVSPDIIARGWEEMSRKFAAIPVIPVVDSLRLITKGGSISVDRSEYVAVQTPQVFHTARLKEAYKSASDRNFTDDAAVMEHAGYEIALFEGNPDNIKITDPKDMAIAEVLMNKCKTDA